MDVKKQMAGSVQLINQVQEDENLIGSLQDTITLLLDTYRRDGKVLFCGNGGSAADAQHLAAELSGCFYLDREPLNAEALHVNTSFITATANDHGFEVIYERLVKATGKPGDVLMAFSTSGLSPNIIRALQAAKDMNMKTVGFTGQDGGHMPEWCDIVFHVPSVDTPRIQEIHMLLGHIICENVESMLFDKG